MGNSTGSISGLDWPGLPAVTVRRSILKLAALTVVFALMAVYGDTFVAGRLGVGISLLGLFGILVVAPTLISRCLPSNPRDSRFRPD